MRRSLSLCLLLCLSSGCSLFNRVHVDRIATSYQKPSNVAAYVAVDDAGDPIVDLQPHSFKIYENEQLLSSDDTQQVLLPQEIATYHHAVLLVDVSGASAGDDRLARAAASFVETLRATQAISVFAFDGSPGLRLVAEISKSADTGPVDLRALSKLGSTDSSRNLNGAVLAGLKELAAHLAAQPKVVRVGTLAVFTRGADLAGRVSPADLDEALRQTTHDLVAIGIADLAGPALSAIGKNGVSQAADDDGLGVAFENAALRARALYNRRYLLAYCSPARGGIRHLRVEVQFRDKEGDDKSASFDEDFDASGFGPGCHADALPHFTPQLAAPAARKAGNGEPKQKAEEPEAPSPVAPPASDDESVAPPPNKPGYSR